MSIADVPGGQPTSRPPVIGREPELRSLTGGLEDALAGRGGLYVIFGEAGIGKSRLAEWTGERARERGARVVWGRCWETVDTPAYWPWTQAIRQILEPLEEEERTDAIGGGLASIARIAPGASYPDDRDLPGTTRIEEFDAVTGLFKRVATKEPIVLILEDVHAADESSQLMLQYLARETKDAPVLVIATCDPTQSRPAPHAGFITDIAREGVAISLSGIGEEAIAQLYEVQVGQKPAAPLVAGLHHATEGNPLFLNEAISMLSTTGDLHRPDHSAGFRVPRTLRDILRRRLVGLSDEVAALVSIASVIGREFDVSLLARVAEMDPDTALDLLDAGCAVGAVQETGALGRFRFVHVLVREAVYEDLTAANRMRLHRRVAETIEELFGSDTGDRFPELAHHWFKAAQAGDPSRALSYTQRAAERADARGAFEEAARLYQRAIKVAELAAATDEEMAAIRQALQRARAATGAIDPDAPESLQGHRFLREGEYFTVVYQGTTSRLKDSKGLRLLAHVLANPGREFHVLDLVNASQGSGVTVAAAEVAQEDLTSDGLGDAGELLDAPAKAAYKRRIADLQEEIAEAEDFNDPEKAARAQEELDALVQQLSGAVGLGGRDRKAASAAERARVSVTKNIKDALKRISENDSALGSHLVSTVRTGTSCSYTPDPRVPVQWEV